MARRARALRAISAACSWGRASRSGGAARTRATRAPGAAATDPARATTASRSAGLGRSRAGAGERLAALVRASVRHADSQRISFLLRNTLATPLRDSLLLQAFAAAAFPLALGGAFLVRAGKSAVPALVRAGELCAPLVLSCFVPSLLNATEWYDKPLPYLLQLLAFVLVLERLLLRAFGGPTHPNAGYVPPTDGNRSVATRVVPLVIVVLFAAGYSAYMSYYTICVITCWARQVSISASSTT